MKTTWYNNIIKHNIKNNKIVLFDNKTDYNELSLYNLNYKSKNFLLLNNVIDVISDNIYSEIKNFNLNLIINIYYLMNKFFKFNINKKFYKLEYLNNKYLLLNLNNSKSFFVIKDNYKNFYNNFFQNSFMNFLDCNKKFIYNRKLRYKNYNFLLSYKNKLRKKLFLKQTRFNNIDNEDFLNFGPENGLYFQTISNSFRKKREEKRRRKQQLFHYNNNIIKKTIFLKKGQVFLGYNFKSLSKLNLFNLDYIKFNNNFYIRKKYCLEKNKKNLFLLFRKENLLKYYNKKYLKYKKFNIKNFYNNYYFLFKKLLYKKNKNKLYRKRKILIKKKFKNKLYNYNLFLNKLNLFKNKKEKRNLFNIRYNFFYKIYNINLWKKYKRKEKFLDYIKRIKNNFYSLKLYKRKEKRIKLYNYSYLIKRKKLLNYNFLYFIKNLYINSIYNNIKNKFLYKNYKKFYIMNKFLYTINSNIDYKILKIFLIILNNIKLLNNYKISKNVKNFFFKNSFNNILKKRNWKQINKYLYFRIFNKYNYNKINNYKYKKKKIKKFINIKRKNSKFFIIKKSTTKEKKIYKFDKFFYNISLNLIKLNKLHKKKGIKKKNYFNNNKNMKSLINYYIYNYNNKDLLNFNIYNYNCKYNKFNKDYCSHKYKNFKVYKYKNFIFNSYELDYYDIINKFHKKKWNFYIINEKEKNDLYYKWKSIKIPYNNFLVFSCNINCENYLIKVLTKIKKNYIFYSKNLLNNNSIISKRKENKSLKKRNFISYNCNLIDNLKLNKRKEKNLKSWTYYLFINNNLIKEKRKIILKPIKEKKNIKNSICLWKKRNWFINKSFTQKSSYLKFYNRKKKVFILIQKNNLKKREKKLLNLYLTGKKRRFYRYNNITSFFLNYKFINNNKTLLFKQMKKKLKILFKKGLFKKSSMYFFRRTLLVEYPKWSLIKENYFKRNEDNIMSYLSKYIHFKIYNIYRKIYNIDLLFLKRINQYKNFSKLNYSKILINIRSNLLQYFYNKNKTFKSFIKNKVYYNKFLVKNVSIKNYILFNNINDYTNNYKNINNLKYNNSIYSYYKYFLKLVLFNNLILKNNYTKKINCDISLFITKFMKNLNIIYKYIYSIKYSNKKNLNYYSKLNEINFFNNIYDYDYSLLNNNSLINYKLNTVTLLNSKKY